MRSSIALLLIVAAAGCEKSKPEPTKRATVHRVGGTTFELVPSEGQYEHCLAYTVSRSGLTRQLTMAKSNMSFHCPAGRPVGGHPFKVPLNEGPVKVFVFFTSQSVNAGSLSQQILDSPNRQALSVMDMRLPGQAALEVLEFTPEEDVEPSVGEVLGVDAGTPAAPSAAEDAGQP
ncbi:MAG: hypothetical protein ACOZQL_35800 [Myxococcota bacterium]